MNRRNFLLGAGASLGIAAMGVTRTPTALYSGWVPMANANANAPLMRTYGASIEGTSKGKRIVLTDIYERVTGLKYAPFAQELGDCTGEASVGAAQLLTTTQIALKKTNEEWRGPYSVEYTYATGRVEIGGGKIGKKDGLTGTWAVEAMQKYGLLLRGKYGKHDLTSYRPDLCKLWGMPKVGVPNELEAIGKEHPVKIATLLESWEQAADCVANGFPCIICTGMGFDTDNYLPVTTDDEGFLIPPKRAIPWYHAWLLGGIDRKSKRPGGLLLNSWGLDWVTGAKHRLGTPPGGVWVDADVLNRMICFGAQEQWDSYAISDFQGFKRRNLEYLLY